MGKLWDWFWKKKEVEGPSYMRREPYPPNDKHYWGYQVLEVVDGKAIRVLTLLDAGREDSEPFDAPRAVVRTPSVGSTLLLTDVGHLSALPEYQKETFDSLWNLFKNSDIQEW